MVLLEVFRLVACRSLHNEWTLTPRQSSPLHFQAWNLSIRSIDLDPLGDGQWVVVSPGRGSAVARNDRGIRSDHTSGPWRSWSISSLIIFTPLHSENSNNEVAMQYELEALTTCATAFVSPKA